MKRGLSQPCANWSGAGAALLVSPFANGASVRTNEYSGSGGESSL